MYNQLDLYYLQQMGIRPWVIKNTVLPAQKSALLVLLPHKIDKKSQLLLNAIVKFINDTDNKDVTIEVVSDTDCDISQIVSAHKNKVAAIVSFGVSLAEKRDKTDSTCPIISTVDLDYLINNPRAKKMVYQELLAIKTLEAGSIGH